MNFLLSKLTQLPNERNDIVAPLFDEFSSFEGVAEAQNLEEFVEALLEDLRRGVVAYVVENA